MWMAAGAAKMAEALAAPKRAQARMNNLNILTRVWVVC